MRSSGRTMLLASLAVLAAAALTPAFGCHEANSMTGPDTGSTTVSVAGRWAGTFQPATGTCSDSSASATFQQNGSQVTGTFSAPSCGPSGAFRGSLSGNSLTGAIAMQGCTGGGVSGTLSASGLSLTIGDLRKPLITGDQIVMPGGSVQLRR